MIAFLRGRIIHKQPNLIIIDVQGVGYEVHVPLSTYYEAGEPGAEAALRIHTHVREGSEPSCGEEADSGVEYALPQWCHDFTIDIVDRSLCS